MFGLRKETETDKKGPQMEFLFDLEKELKTNPDHCKELVRGVQENCRFIKDYLGKGAPKDEFTKLSVILYGYVAFLKVLTRAVERKKS
jgi:hypothetical protein